MSIRTLLLLLVLAVWLPAVAGFALLARTTYLREADDARQDIERFAQSLSSLVEGELDKRVAIASTLGASRTLLEAPLRRFHEEAGAAMRDSGDWVMLVDRERLLLNTQVPYDGYTPTDRPPGSTFVTAAPRVTFSVQSLLAKDPVLVAYAAERREPVRYNVGVAFSPAVVQRLIDKTAPFGSLAAVLNAEQLIVARNRDPQKWVGQPAGAEVQRRAKTGTSSYGETVTLDGVPSLTYVSSANRHGWNVVLALPQEALTQSAQRLTAQTLAAAGALLLIGLGIAIAVTRKIGQPIVQLHEAALQLGRDEVPTALSTGVAELDEVSRTLEQAGRRSHEATLTLQKEVALAVDEARKAQAALLEGQKREAIGRLTGGLAHDFNNLLQTISTGLHVVDRQTGDEVPHRRFLEAAMRATGKAADLVKQMMTFGRAQPLRPQPVKLLNFVLQTQELTRKAVGERVQLTAEIEPALPAVLVDPAQLELALLNLIFNARDAMPEGGAIRISARMANSEESAPLGGKQHVCLQVSDNGAGMSPETRERAFDPYFTTKPIGAGTGLGLAQVLAFARQSNGDARLDSMAGVGTRVTLLLPVTHQAELAVEPEATAREAGRALSILMIEDDSLVSSVVVPALRDAGHEVTHSSSADQAQAVLTGRTDFDVLFTDVVMPGKLSGLDLVDWCRVHLPAMAAVVATGYNTRETRADVQELRKPYSLDDLLAALQRAVQDRVQDRAAGSAASAA
ncbi:ATP-binding protein [Piscinibacter sp. HJYY11]|uniref:ATP-binding protein n=1 Tax=Piscinibacter sp. HJYY11 TaxID=2801333 RepID=UPI00191E19CE|nr:ATP-binding protein [Piscinibacter sp. HJYY11]MBL0730062.1 response regulator [Piscinibacter sp. HJYY11]